MGKQGGSRRVLAKQRGKERREEKRREEKRVLSVGGVFLGRGS